MALFHADLSLQIGNEINKKSYIDMKSITSLSSKMIKKYNLFNEKGIWIDSSLFECINSIYYTYGIIGASNICEAINNKTFNVKDYIEILKKKCSNDFELYFNNITKSNAGTYRFTIDYSSDEYQDAYVDGIKLKLRGGHTKGSMSLETGKNLFVGDTIFTHENLIRKIPAGYTADRDVSDRLLCEYLKYNGRIITSHDINEVKNNV